MLPLAVPLAVCEAAEELRAGTRCGVKWPNDVLVEGRKLAGILVEARPQDGWAVVGVGLNLTISPEEFPPELRTVPSRSFISGERGRGGVQRSLPAVAPADPAAPLPQPSFSHRLGAGSRPTRGRAGGLARARRAGG